MTTTDASNTMSHLTVGEACTRLRERYPNTVPLLTAKDISDVCYRSRVLSAWPVVSGRRLIPEAEMESLVWELRRYKKLPPAPQK